MTLLSDIRRALPLLLVVTALVWLGAVHPGWVDYDTPWLVRHNVLLSSPDPGVLARVWTDLSLGTRMTLGAEYLPVRDTTVWLDHQLFGLDMRLHHLHSLAWYLVACGLVLVVARDLLGPGPRSFLAALLFAVHPVHVESVVWLASRKDVVSLALLLLAMVLWRRGRERPWLFLLSALLGLLAHWAKNTAIVLPGMLGAWSLLVDRPDLRRPAWWLQWLPYALTTAIGLGMSLSLGDTVSMYAAPRAHGPVELLALMGQVWAHYLGTLVAPLSLSVAYVEPVVRPLSDPAVFSSLALVGGLLAVSLALWRRAPVITLGAAWFALGLLPVSQLIPLQNLMADRYLLIPSLGMAVALCAVPLPAAFRIPAGVAAGLASLLLGVATVRYLPVFASSEALWRRVVEVEPGLERGWIGLSGALQEAGRPDEAAAVSAEAQARLGPRPGLLANQGWLRLEAGDLVAAEASLRRAWEADPSQRKAGNNLVATLHRQGRLDEALAVAEALTRTHPLYAEGWATRAAVHVDRQEPGPARDAALHALEVDPANVAALVNLGSAAVLAGDVATARAAWERVLLLQPDHAYVRATLPKLPPG